MAKLDPRIEAVRERYELSTDDFWQIPQNKQWVCKHAALEIVATKAKVEWSQPQIIEANTAGGIAVMSVSGKMGDRVEWATGEASPKNNKNSYPWAMAEKRAKDRVVLKLVGIHGLVYSEDEADDFKPEVQSKPVAPSDTYKKLDGDMRKNKTADDLRRWWKDVDVVDLRKKLSELEENKLHAEFCSLGASMSGTKVIDQSGRELHTHEAG